MAIDAKPAGHGLPGVLIALEGPDGAGKTTLHAGLAAALCAQGRDVLELREPGGCELAEHLRRILKGEAIPGALTSARAEALLFAAARAQLIDEVIRPALAAGRIVLLDRFIGSSLVYQGEARGLGRQAILDVSLFATGGIVADRTLLLAVSDETAAARRAGRDGEAGDRIEESTDARMIRELYGRLDELDPSPVVKVSAEGSPPEVLARALDAVSGALAASPAARARRAALELAASGSREFRARSLTGGGVTLAAAQQALDELAAEGVIAAQWDAVCPESGRTLARFASEEDFKASPAVRCGHCDEDEHPAQALRGWVTYRPADSAAPRSGAAPQ